MNMSIGQKIFMIIGSAFAGIGIVVSVIIGYVGSLIDGAMVFVLIPLFFVVLGLVFIICALSGIYKKKQIVKRGTKYAAKIYGYVENTSYVVNGKYPLNVKVHYFDNKKVEREAVLPTAFLRGSSQYPIGMTIDIYEYNGKYGYDPSSVRNEVLPGESELMDDKPMEPGKIKYVAKVCPNCGASFQAASGYSNKCPYCGSYQNIT